MRAVWLLLAALSVTAQRQDPDLPNAGAPKQPPGSISGTVTDASTGAPIQGANVMLAGLTGVSRNLISGAGGTFSADALAAGTYLLAVTHQNYPGPMGLYQKGRLITIEPGKALTDVTLSLTPGGSITGRILSDDGEPLTNCNVVLTQQPIGGGALRQSAVAQTDDDGEFRLAPLAPDRYLLSARCSEALPVEHLIARTGPEGFEPAAGWRTLYYPDSPALSGAGVITVTASSTTQIEMHMTETPVATVQGTVIGASGSTHLTLVPQGGPPDPTAQFSTGAEPDTGRFRFPMVPPGTYDLNVVPVYQRDGGASAYAKETIQVGPTPPAPLMIQVQPSITLSGKVEEPPAAQGGTNGPSLRMRAEVRGEGRPVRPAPKGTVILTPVGEGVDAGGRAGPASAEDGSFSIPGLTPGDWRVSYQGFQSGGYIDSMQYGETAGAGRVIHIAAGGTTQLQIKLANNNPNPQYDLQEAGRQSNSFWGVYAVPPGEAEGRPDSIVAMTMPGRTAVPVRPLEPGRYSFFAIEQSLGGMVQGRILELVRRQVPPIDVAAGRDQTIAVRAFSYDDILGIVNAYIAGQAQ